MQKIVVILAVLLMGVWDVRAQELPELTMRQLCDMRAGRVVDPATSKTVELAQELMKRTQAPGTLLVCRVSHNAPMPLLRIMVGLGQKKEHMLVVSDAYESMSAQGLYPLLAHEVMHAAVPPSWSPYERPTTKQHADYEADIDRRVVQLVGPVAFETSLDELERLLIASLDKAKDEIKNDIKNRRRRLQE